MRTCFVLGFSNISSLISLAHRERFEHGAEDFVRSSAAPSPEEDITAYGPH
jgi:hypothetical protein